jgi:phage tail protein X
MNLGFAYECGLRGASPISAGWEDFGGGSAVLPTLNEGLEIELSDFDTQNATLKGDSLWQVAEIVIGGVPTILDVHCMCFLMSLCITLLQGCVSKNQMNQIRL